MRRRSAAALPPEPPPLPHELIVYDPARWLLPDDPPEPTDSADAVAWAAFEDAHRAAYGRHLAARQVWINEHGQPSIEAALAVPDEPFDPADLWRFNPADL